MYYVYALKSLKDNKYYFGQTDNVIKRVNLHNSGKVLSTKTRRPLKLIGYRAFETRGKAMFFEHNLKSHGDRKQKFIKSLKAGGPLESKKGGLRPVAPLGAEGW